MGFHITIELDREDRRLLDALRSSPEDVFGRPYAGYLLFLIGGADVEALEWLKQHLVPLDSLTGHDVAFAIFAEKVPLRLSVPYDPHGARWGYREPKILGDVPIAKVQRIDSYIKSGNLGIVANGDQINAITYATDRLARAFGVLDQLPCLLVLDAFPADQIDVIELNANQLEVLFSVLRSAINRLTDGPGFIVFNEHLKTLQRSQEEINRLSWDIKQQKRALSEIPVTNDLELSIRDCYKDLLNELNEGSHHRFAVALGKLEELTGRKVEYELDEPTGRRIVGYGKTLSALKKLENESWPLTGKTKDHFHNVLRYHVARLLPNVPVSIEDATHTDVENYRKLLANHQIELIDTISASLPSEIELFADAKQHYANRRVALEQELATLQLGLETARDSARRSLDICLSEGAPSLSKILRKLAQERKLRLVTATVKDKMSAYAGQVLNPQNVMRIIGTVAGGFS
jgi:DNA-directed RNA polymerase beta subunit